MTSVPEPPEAEDVRGRPRGQIPLPVHVHPHVHTPSLGKTAGPAPAPVAMAMAMAAGTSRQGRRQAIRPASPRASPGRLHEQYIGPALPFPVPFPVSAPLRGGRRPEVRFG